MEAGDNDLAMAKVKAKSKAKSKVFKGPAAAGQKHATFGEAGAAAQACAKYPPRKDGSEGRRARVTR
eukprot:5993577-Pyramimonas_sp.AAC.1